MVSLYKEAEYMLIKKEWNLLGEVCDIMRLHHYSIHTERTYIEWIKRFVQRTSLLELAFLWLFLSA